MIVFFVIWRNRLLLISAWNRRIFACFDGVWVRVIIWRKRHSQHRAFWTSSGNAVWVPFFSACRAYEPYHGSSVVDVVGIRRAFARFRASKQFQVCKFCIFGALSIVDVNLSVCVMIDHCFCFSWRGRWSSRCKWVLSTQSDLFQSSSPPRRRFNWDWWVGVSRVTAVTIITVVGFL